MSKESFGKVICVWDAWKMEIIAGCGSQYNDPENNVWCSSKLKLKVATVLDSSRRSEGGIPTVKCVKQHEVLTE